MWRLSVAAALLAATAGTALGHGSLPARLELEEHASGRYLGFWNSLAGDETRETPFPGDPLRVVFPAHCTLAGFADRLAPHGHFHLDCGEGSLRGHRITVHGLSTRYAEAVVSLRHLDGTQRQEVLTAAGNVMHVDEPPVWYELLLRFMRLGGEHILGGVDHLLFLTTVLLLFSELRQRVVVVTAFTVGHSASLVLATLGLLRPPMGSIEVLIAWTVVFAACEAFNRWRAQPGAARPTLSRRHPWLITGAFGFIHGFGFAAALAETGLPARRLAMPLAGFNLGVEIGQLLVVGILLGGLAFLRRLPPVRAVTDSAAAVAVPRMAALLVGATAMYWVLDRMAGLAWPQGG